MKLLVLNCTVKRLYIAFIMCWMSGVLYAQDQLKAEEVTLNFPNGDQYQGGFKEGKKHGQGTYIWAHGDRYIGDYQMDQRTGQGTYIWKNQDQYQGAFINGVRTGQGILTLNDGTRYEGEFLDDQWHGRGILEFRGGNRYEGTFKNGQQDGLGVFTWSNGDKYIGEFKKGQRQGRGEMIKQSGDRFVGYYKSNTREGYGVRFDQSDPGRAKELQYWSNGQLAKYYSLDANKDCKLRINNQQQQWFYLGEQCIDGWAHGTGSAVTIDGKLIILDKKFVLGHPVEGGIKPL